MKRLIAVALLTLISVHNTSLSWGETHKQEKKMANTAEDIATLAPEFVKLTQETLFGDIWKRPGLSQKEKSLVVITALAALGRTEQIDYHLGFGLDNGLTRDEIVAAMTHLAFYAGWPAAMTGLTHFKKVLDERNSQKHSNTK